MRRQSTRSGHSAQRRGSCNVRTLEHGGFCAGAHDPLNDPALRRMIYDIAEVTAKALEGAATSSSLPAMGSSAGDTQHVAGEMLSRLIMTAPRRRQSR